jgi:hypothetical protein
VRSLPPGEVLAVHKHRTSVDFTLARDNAVAHNHVLLHPKLRALVRAEDVVLLERACVEQHIDPLSRRQLALRATRDTVMEK